MTAAMPKNTDALSLAGWIDSDFDPDEMLERGYDAIAAELRRAADEIRQLKDLNARLQPTIEDDSQNWAKCDPAIAFHLIDRHSDNWADAGKMMTEFADAKAELKMKALRDELTAQTNRAAAAEQQVTALTQRLDMANRLNTDARNQLAEQAASERLAMAYPKAAEMFHPLYVQGFKAGYRRGGARGKRSVLRQVGKLMDEVITMSPPPAQTNMVGLRQIKPAPAEQSNSAEFDGIKTHLPEQEPLTELQKQALDMYKPPFQFHHGYIFDSAGHMFADEGRPDEAASLIAVRIRGWGRLGKLSNGAEVQDAAGHLVVAALNAFWKQHAIGAKND